MNAKEIDRHLVRVMLMAILIHVYRDWGGWGGMLVLSTCMAYAFFAEWMRVKKEKEENISK